MDRDRVRAHIVLPRELVEEIDALAGHRQRSEFLAEAARERLARLRREKVLRETAGALRGDYPEWDTPDAVSAWVRESRRRDEAGFRHAWAGSDKE